MYKASGNAFYISLLDDCFYISEDPFNLSVEKILEFPVEPATKLNAGRGGSLSEREQNRQIETWHNQSSITELLSVDKSRQRLKVLLKVKLKEKRWVKTLYNSLIEKCLEKRATTTLSFTHLVIFPLDIFCAH